MTCKAVIFDYIGTLVNCRGYNMADSENTLYTSLHNAGFDVGKQEFLDAYEVAHQKYRIVRYQQYREVTNAVWVAEALTSLGGKVTAEDDRVKTALNMFFQDFLNTLELREGAKKLLKTVASEYRLGLISNFTYAPVIHRSLRKVGIDTYFNAMVVSDDIGWRKPSPKIFQHMLQRLQVTAEETIFVGDSPLEDIKGAMDIGLKTIFIPSQFNTLKNLKESKQQPDCIAKNLQTITKELTQLTKMATTQ
ncbi:MAG TPA: HAD family hydrolase [Candidatus Acidoferrales bacterium]|nr:HAD family hydrolase [Candidatus Acidoferrales bacterium]